MTKLILSEVDGCIFVCDEVEDIGPIVDLVRYFLDSSEGEALVITFEVGESLDRLNDESGCVRGEITQI